MDAYFKNFISTTNIGNSIPREGQSLSSQTSLADFYLMFCIKFSLILRHIVYRWPH